MKIRNFFVFLLIIFLAITPAANAQNTSTPPDVGNSQVLKATGAPFKEGWNYFTLGFSECTAKTVLDELQADGGSTLKATTLFTKELFNWQPYSFLNSDAKNKKIGENQLLAFYSNQKFFLEMDQKACLNPDSERQAQIDIVREGTSGRSSFVEQVRELPIDLWTKLMDLLNNNGVSSFQNTTQPAKQDFENLTIGGKTTVNDLGITGKITSGLLSIEGLNSLVASGSATINTLSNDLYLQNLGLGGLNILNGKVTIDVSGNLKLESGSLTARTVETEQIKILGSKSSGSSILPANTTSLDISAESATENARILLTPTTITDKVLIVSKKEAGKFTVSVKEVDPQDINFDWFIIQ